MYIRPTGRKLLSLPDQMFFDGEITGFYVENVSPDVEFSLIVGGATVIRTKFVETVEKDGGCYVKIIFFKEPFVFPAQELTYHATAVGVGGRKHLRSDQLWLEFSYRSRRSTTFQMPYTTNEGDTVLLTFGHGMAGLVPV